MVPYRIDLLGRPPRLWRADSSFTPLNRRDALVIAYLALRGATTRDELAEKLWPDIEPEHQSNNLRALLFKMRRRIGEDALQEKDEALWLSDACSIDAVRVVEAYLKRDWAAVVASSPELLGGLIYDDEPELDRWLDQQRDQFLRRHAVALGHEVERLEQEGQREQALELAGRRLQLDPWSDDACRKVMALKVQLGGRMGALREYAAFCAVLERDLGVKPEERTRQLAEDIRKLGCRPSPGAKPELPLSVRHPPLVGREQAWMEMEEAWRRRVPIIYVCGQAGHGKSRLMTDFAQAQTDGSFFQSSAWPGDASVPFRSRSNTIRKLLREYPAVKVDRWSRRQLGRILPEMWYPEELQPPDPGDPAFVEANFRLYREMSRHVGAIVYDDGQYLDHATIDLGLSLEAVCSRMVEAGEFPPILVGIRPGELHPAQEEMLRARAEKGQAAWIDVEPLTPDEVRLLVAGMGCPQLARIAGELAEYSGGSPYVVLEIVRELMSAEGWSGGFPAGFQLAPSVRALLDRKLRKLSPEALRVAQVIALAGDELTVPMLASVAALTADHVAVCLRELERHHLVQGRWFASGAVPPAVLEGTPERTRAELLNRIADSRHNRSFGGLW